MSRAWLAVYTALVTKPRYRRLTPTGRGALLHTWILAGFQDPEATWPDVDELREALMIDGFPAAALDELVALGWVDVEEGSASVHNWDAHQLAATKEAQRAWESSRKRAWRRQKKGASPAPLTPTEQHTTPQHIGPGHGTDMSGTNRVDGVSEGLALLGDDAEGFDEVYAELYHRNPSEKASAYGACLEDRFDRSRVTVALRAEHRKDPNPRTVIGRMERGLKAGDRKAWERSALAAMDATQ